VGSSYLEHVGCYTGTDCHIAAMAAGMQLERDQQGELHRNLVGPDYTHKVVVAAIVRLD
jgi:hypothetical protein